MRMMMKAKLGLIITAMSTVVGIFPKQTKITPPPPLFQDFINLDGLRENFCTVILLILI